MDFSSRILLDFGLNLAGYLVAALLVYLFVGRVNRAADEESAGEAIPEASPARTASDPAARRPKPDPEYVPLMKQKKATTEPAEVHGNDRKSPGIADDEGGADWRRRNRQAIYAEARRLLAGGTSRSDLLSRLPVTESELDMLTVTGKA